MFEDGHGLLAPPSESPTDLPGPVDIVKGNRLKELSIMLTASAVVTLFDDAVEFIRLGPING